MPCRSRILLSNQYVIRSRFSGFDIGEAFCLLVCQTVPVAHSCIHLKVKHFELPLYEEVSYS